MKDVVILSFDALYLKVFSCEFTAFQNHGVDGWHLPTNFDML